MTKHVWTCAAVLVSMTAWTYAGPLTGNSLLVNGEFEIDPHGTQEPTGWTLDTSSWAGWVGVTQYEYLCGHPKPRGSQGAPQQCYGTFLADADSGWGEITQTVSVGAPSSTPVEAWIRGWVYTADQPGSYVRFELDQGQNHWQSPDLYDVGDGNGWWSDWAFQVPTDQGFTVGDLSLTVRIDLIEGGVNVAWHGMFVDGLELEVQPIPEPAGISLLAAGGLWFIRRRRISGRR